MHRRQWRTSPQCLRVSYISLRAEFRSLSNGPNQTPQAPARMRMACQHLLRLQKSRPWSLGGFIRALNSPGSGMSDAHRPVYWLRGSSRHAPPSQENSQWLQPFLRLRGACARRLQLQGQPSSRPCGPRCVPVEPSRAPARYSESPKRLATISVLRDGTAVKIRLPWKLLVSRGSTSKH
jgi:hypothetical protein